MTERTGTSGNVPVRLPLPIRTLTWEADTAADGWRWLLPAAAVLEVTRCEMPAPMPLPLDTASALVRALLGTVAWRGRRLPLLSLLADEAEGVAEPAAGSATMGGIARLRAVVCPCLGDEAVIPAFGLAAQGLPSLLTLREGEVEPGGAGAVPPPFAVAVLRVRGARYVVPDLDALSAALAPLGGLLD